MVNWHGVNIWVHFHFTPGCPQTGPSYASGGEPASPPEIDIELCEIVDDDERVIGVLRTDLQGEFASYAYHELVNSADEQLAPDPERQREDQWDDICRQSRGEP